MASLFNIERHHSYGREEHPELQQLQHGEEPHEAVAAATT